MKKSCIIVDDEPAAHYVLMSHLNQVPDLEVIGQFYNGIEAQQFLEFNEVDLMFLDINMPEITGLDLLRHLSHPPKTVLTTAYSEFALESYDYGVIDYLMKPIYFPRFLLSVDRFFSYYNVSDRGSVVVAPSSLAVKVDGVMVDIDLNELLYTQSLGNYVKLFTPNKTYLASITTNDLEHSLPAAKFMRIHKSYIVSIDRIAAYGKDYVQINDFRMPVGITYRQKLMEKMNG
ncbi:response regulator transcription factor [Chitinophaga horti]|uniref:Response regulator transcription factor n=1 Tax=Chitinophaga horti TaxID=2920382 RepID=A0ABY6J321_9BACT|nr:response regulator transcription factor [Chitinophaga horti]UYQ94069.1 response regulator transcription factor [Chitinophaga horti]